MASYTDQISQFNPYVSRLPLIQEMGIATQEKQQKYDQGVQKIQGYIDNIAGMPVANDADKAYLQSKLGELGNNLKIVAAGDFSNSQLVNSVGGMATQIVKDPTIQTAVSSTAQLRKEGDKMQKAIDDGKSNPANVDQFREATNKYLSSTSAGTKFNSSYVPFFDVDKDVQDAITKAHLSSNDWEENGLNPDGSVNPDILIEKSKKGLLSGKVKSIVDGIFSKPEVQQQLAISGVYQFKNYTPEMLKSAQDESINYIRNKAKETKERIACVGVVSDYEAANANKAIIDIDNQLQSSEEKYGKYMKLLNEGKIDEAKISLYRDDKEAQYQNSYSWEENSMKSKVNPWFTVQMTRANYNLALQREIFNEGDANRKFNEQVRQFGLTFSLQQQDELRKQQIAAGKLNADGSPKVLYTQGAANPDVIAKLGSSSYKDNTQALKDQANQLQAKVISTLPGFEDLYINKDGVYKFNYAKYQDWKTIEPKYRMALVELEKAHMNGTVKPNYRQDVQQMHDLQSLVSQNTQVEKEIDDKYKPVIDIISSKMTNPSTPNTGLIKTGNNGQINGIPVTKEDIVQYWLSANGKDENAKEAAKRYIESKFPASEGEPYSGAGSIGIIFKKQYNEVSDILDKNPGLGVAFKNREEDYRNLQQQHQSYYATLNIGKPEEKLLANQKYSNLLAKVMGGKKTGGVYGEMAKMLSSKDANELNENLYDYWRGSDGKWYAQVRRNLGSGEGYKYSEVLPITKEDALQLGAKEDPIEDAFISKFGGYLNNFGGKQTTKNLISPDAENAAIDRRPVGKYSVGWQLKELNGGYVPYAYVRDRNGNVLSSGMEVDFSVYSKDPTLTPTQRQGFANVQSIMSRQDVLTKLPLIDEHLITLMLNNNR
jgi:hypothetical protein